MWPPTIEYITLFIAWLSLQGFTYNTARLYVSAVGFQCKLKGLEEVSKHYVIQKALEGFKRSGRLRRTRLPITQSILRSVLSALPSVCANAYETKLFTAAYCLAFFAFLRIGELAVGNKKCISHVIAGSDVSLAPSGSSFNLIIRSSKTDQYGHGARLKVSCTGASICPVTSMSQFLSQRPPVKGPLFCHLNGYPLTRYQFTCILKKCLRKLQLDYESYTSHSFRIGAATTAAMAGCSTDTIKQAGRWRSDAYRVYIRPDSAYTVPKLL